jgi:hydrogenase maturation protease
MKRILIAGIGNIFLGDDAFGVEVVRELPHHVLPTEVRVMDFGIRGYDLAYALADDYHAAILVDATPRGESPGTLYLIEPDLTNLGQLDHTSVDPHSLGPVRVLQMAEALGGHPRRLYLVGCEPGELHLEEGGMGLSDAVQAAVPKAVEMIQSLVRDLLHSETTTIGAGVVPA